MTAVYDLYTLEQRERYVLRIECLEIDDRILDKIETKHGVTFEEVEECCLSEARHVRRSRGGLYKIFGVTAGGRRVLAVLVDLGSGVWRVATAREMSGSERRLYEKVRRGR